MKRLGDTSILFYFLPSFSVKPPVSIAHLYPKFRHSEFLFSSFPCVLDTGEEILLTGQGVTWIAQYQFVLKNISSNPPLYFLKKHFYFFLLPFFLT